MKTVLRKTLLNSLSLWLTSLVAPGLKISDYFPTILIAGLVLLLLQNLVKPVLQIITLPLNLLTLGLFAWVLNIFTLYLLTLVVPGIKVSPFIFKGITLADFVIPKLEFNQWTAFIVVAFTLTLIQKFLKWVL